MVLEFGKDMAVLICGDCKKIIGVAYEGTADNNLLNTQVCLECFNTKENLEGINKD